MIMSAIAIYNYITIWKAICGNLYINQRVPDWSILYAKYITTARKGESHGTEYERSLMMLYIVA